jgi:hypothetical protein
VNVILTIREIFDRDLWDKVCEIKGFDPWGMAEGKWSDSDTVVFTPEESVKLGLIKGPFSHKVITLSDKLSELFRNNCYNDQMMDENTFVNVVSRLVYKQSKGFEVDLDIIDTHTM